LQSRAVEGREREKGKEGKGKRGKRRVSCTEKPRHHLYFKDGPGDHTLRNGDSSALQETQLSTLTGNSSARAQKNTTGSRSSREK